MSRKTIKVSPFPYTTPNPSFVPSPSEQSPWQKGPCVLKGRQKLGRLTSFSQSMPSLESPLPSQSFQRVWTISAGGPLCFPSLRPRADETQPKSMGVHVPFFLAAVWCLHPIRFFLRPPLPNPSCRYFSIGRGWLAYLSRHSFVFLRYGQISSPPPQRWGLTLGQAFPRFLSYFPTSAEKTALGVRR